MAQTGFAARIAHSRLGLAAACWPFCAVLLLGFRAGARHRRRGQQHRRKRPTRRRGRAGAGAGSLSLRAVEPALTVYAADLAGLFRLQLSGAPAARDVDERRLLPRAGYDDDAPRGQRHGVGQPATPVSPAGDGDRRCGDYRVWGDERAGQGLCRHADSGPTFRDRRRLVSVGGDVCPRLDHLYRPDSRCAAHAARGPRVGDCPGCRVGLYLYAGPGATPHSHLDLLQPAGHHWWGLACAARPGLRWCLWAASPCTCTPRAWSAACCSSGWAIYSPQASSPPSPKSQPAAIFRCSSSTWTSASGSSSACNSPAACAAGTSAPRHSEGKRESSRPPPAPSRARGRGPGRGPPVPPLPYSPSPGRRGGRGVRSRPVLTLPQPRGCGARQCPRSRFLRSHPGQIADPGGRAGRDHVAW